MGFVKREWKKLSISLMSFTLIVFAVFTLSFYKGVLFDKNSYTYWSVAWEYIIHTLFLEILAILFIAFLIFFNLLLWLPRLQRAIFRVPSDEEIAERKRLKQERKKERLRERLEKLK